MSIHWLDSKSYAKAEGQLRLQIGEILSVFDMYGQGAYIVGALEEIIEVAIDFSKRVRGEEDQPIRVKSKRNPRGK